MIVYTEYAARGTRPRRQPRRRRHNRFRGRLRRANERNVYVRRGDSIVFRARARDNIIDCRRLNDVLLFDLRRERVPVTIGNGRPRSAADNADPAERSFRTTSFNATGRCTTRAIYGLPRPTNMR